MQVHPLTLRFSSKSLEHRYATFRQSQGFELLDWFTIYLNLVSQGWFVVYEFVKTQPNGVTDRAGGWASLLSFSVVCIQYLVMRSDVWKPNRTPFVVFFRSIRLIGFCNGAPKWIKYEVMDSSALFKTIILRSGSLVQIWIGLGMPLPFLEHLVLQTLAVFCMALVPGRRMCKEAFRNNDAPLLALWEFLNDSLLVLGGAPLNHQTSREFSAFSACSQLVLLAQLWLGHVVPTLILSKMELSSRRSFVERIGGQRMVVGSDLPGIGQALIFSAVGISCLWGLSTSIGGLIT
ncbi:hypothetical protein BSKO_11468 [Bryopsis sp. KO-2023]|nr:hypothetical protein BSKO_11468 [Bryopsis sp. KO-2023]